MTHKATPLWRSYLAFLIPMIASNILQALSGTVNNIYLGHMLGVQAMAAVSAFFPVQFFLISSMIGMGMGASVLIGRSWGAKEPERVKAIAGTTLTVGFIAGMVVAILGSLFAQPLLELLGTPADILPGTVSYARIMLIAMPLVFVFLLVTSMLRGVGDTQTPLWALLISTAVALVLTPALIRGWLGLPMLGITSGAYAATTGLVVAMAWLGWYLRRHQHALFGKLKHPLAPDAAFFKHLHVKPKLLLSVLRIGLPSSLTIITMALAEISVLFLVNGFGSQATAAYGAVTQIVNYVQFPAISIAIAASILGAQSLGAGRGKAALGHIAKTGILLNGVMTGSLVLLGYVFSRPMIGLFLTEPDVIELAQTLLHVMLWGNIVFGMAMVLSGLMRASGTVLVPTIISLFCIAGVLVPAAWILSKTHGLPGIWAAFPITFLTMLALQTTYYRLVWRQLPLQNM